MINVLYTRKFLKMFNALNQDMQDLVYERVEEFKKTENHRKLKVHKLKGVLKNTYAFSVNRKIRILFEYGKNKEEAILLTIGSHDMCYR